MLHTDTQINFLDVGCCKLKTVKLVSRFNLGHLYSMKSIFEFVYTANYSISFFVLNEIEEAFNNQLFSQK